MVHPSELPGNRRFNGPPMFESSDSLHLPGRYRLDRPQSDSDQRELRGHQSARRRRRVL